MDVDCRVLRKISYNREINSAHFLQYSECLAYPPFLLYNSNDSLNLRISANPDNGEGSLQIGKSLYVIPP